ncbi:MAG: YqeG family HAD IIIA-type phosphatase [Ruminococcaceae bacterium]|nr:YqeG family HAD IIIA-type phosphatase [Oscillospiraceae bacterium]
MKKELKRKKSVSLVPEYVFDTYRNVSAEFLTSLGIRALLIDIDNTLAPYEQDLPDENIIAWFEQMRAADIRCALISNNHADRVELFNSLLSLHAYPDSKKPCKKTLLRAMSDMSVDASVTAGLGDQLLTDTLAVHKLGMISIIVPPIKDKKTLFFRFKRMLERPFMRIYRRRKKKKGGQNI